MRLSDVLKGILLFLIFSFQLGLSQSETFCSVSLNFTNETEQFPQKQR